MELHVLAEMDIGCDRLHVNITYALRWGVASVGNTLLGVAHPIRETFHVGEIHRRMAPFRTLMLEESRMWLYFVLM